MKEAKLKREVIPGRGTTTETTRFCPEEVRAKGTSRAYMYAQTNQYGNAYYGVQQLYETGWERAIVYPTLQ